MSALRYPKDSRMTSAKDANLNQSMRHSWEPVPSRLLRAAAMMSAGLLSTAVLTGVSVIQPQSASASTTFTFGSNANAQPWTPPSAGRIVVTLTGAAGRDAPPVFGGNPIGRGGAGVVVVVSRSVSASDGLTVFIRGGGTGGQECPNAGNPNPDRDPLAGKGGDAAAIYLSTSDAVVAGGGGGGGLQWAKFL